MPTKGIAIAALVLAVGIGGYLFVRGARPAPAPLQGELAGSATPADTAPPAPAPAAPPLQAETPAARGSALFPASAATTASGPTLADDAALTAQLRSLLTSDPGRALALARAANARFPHSAAAAERAWVVVRALAELQRFHEARHEARVVAQRYAGTHWADDVERHLLVYPLDQPSREEQQERERLAAPAEGPP
ncbi:MAG TPA: hypothetical protein VER33_24185 [Polyangiaceae bacterium]|nr:hypothetical protein [Polyangiaceae bacterium]